MKNRCHFLNKNHQIINMRKVISFAGFKIIIMFLLLFIWTESGLCMLGAGAPEEPMELLLEKMTH